MRYSDLWKDEYNLNFALKGIIQTYKQFKKHVGRGYKKDIGADEITLCL